MSRFVQVKFRDVRVQRGLRALDKRRRELRKVFRALRIPLRDDLLSYAEQERSPDGAWPRRATGTDRRSSKRASTHSFTREAGSYGGRRKSGPTQVQTRRMTGLLGKLPVTVSTRSRGASLIAESKVPWAGVHNVGGTVGRGSVIPAREFVFFSPPFLVRAADEISDFVIKGWEQA